MATRQVMRLEVGLEPYPGYRLERRLGAGGFGEVWESQSPTGRAVALKFLACSSDGGTVQELRSLQAIRQLRHPHLVQMDRVWCHLGYVIVSMELAEGNLEDVLDIYQQEFGTALPGDYACSLLAQAAAGLDFLNTKKHVIHDRCVAIQHCDVKPSNMLLFGDRVKVADFGLSSSLASSMQTGRKAGTLGYCAPEVFQGRLSDQTDQYALAVSYCVLRTGRLPFQNVPTSFHAGAAMSFTADLSSLTPEERPIVARALARDPLSRWASCGDLMSRLTRVAGLALAS
jgi:serine/threonine protein kinase, bacterial